MDYSYHIKYLNILQIVWILIINHSIYKLIENVLIKFIKKMDNFTVKISVEDFKNAMSGIYTTTISNV